MLIWASRSERKEKLKNQFLDKLNFLDGLDESFDIFNTLDMLNSEDRDL